jgi:hypothetical protein
VEQELSRENRPRQRQTVLHLLLESRHHVGIIRADHEIYFSLPRGQRPGRESMFSHKLLGLWYASQSGHVVQCHHRDRLVVVDGELVDLPLLHVRLVPLHGCDGEGRDMGFLKPHLLRQPPTYERHAGSGVVEHDAGSGAAAQRDNFLLENRRRSVGIRRLHSADKNIEPRDIFTLGKIVWTN